MKEKSYDIKVTAGTDDYFFMLERRNGARQFQMSPAPALPASSPTGTPGYENYPPQQEIVYTISDLRGGMGQLEYHTDDPFAPYRYATGQSIDTRNRGRIGPGPAINTAILAAGGGAGVAPVRFEEFAGSGSRTLYIACGRYIYSWNGTNIVQVKDAGATEAYTDLKAFSTWLVGARGSADGYDFSTDGTNYTQATITGKEQVYLEMAPDGNGVGTLWGFNTPNSLRGSVDPSNAGSWAAANLVGDTVSQATGLITLSTGLWEAKDDGLYATVGSAILNWTPDFRTIRDANGFKAHTTFAGGGTRRAIVGFQRAIYEVYTTGNYKMIHPGRYGGSGLMNGNCTALTHDDEYVYAAIAGDDGDTFIAAGREETINGTTDWCWHPIIYLGANACNAMWYTNYEGGTPKLWYGKGTDICYSYMHKEPFRDDNTLPTSYILATSWELGTSWNTQRFEDVIKQYKATGTQLRNASSARKITLSSMVDQETTWTSHGDVTTNGITQTAFPTSRTGRRIRERIVGTNSLNSATAILESVVVKSALRPITKRIFYYSIRCADNIGTRVGIGKKSAATIRSDIMAVINTDAQVALEHVNGTTYYVNFVRDGWSERETKDDARASTQGNETTFDVVALESGDAASWIASPGSTLTGTALADGQFWVGNSSNIATPVAMSGDATMSNAGVVTVAATHSGSAHHTRSHDHSAAGDGQALAPGTSITIPNTGLLVKDTDASHTLAITPGSNLTANRILTITTGDAARTVTINGDTTLSGTNTGDQTITLTGEVTGSGTGSFAATVAATHSGSAHHAQAHEAAHISGGADAFLSTDVLEAIVKRLQTTTGPTNLLVGAVVDGEYLRRSGTAIISGAPAASQAIFYPATNAINADSTYFGLVFSNGATGTAYVTGYCPFTPSAIYAVYNTYATGNLYRTINTEFSAANEAVAAHSDTIASGTYAVTASKKTHEDITAAFTGLLSGDSFGCQYQRLGGDASDTSEASVTFLGLLLVP